MSGFKAKLDYILKHNRAINKVFGFLASTFFRFLGLFIKVDEHSILFSGHSRKYNDSPKAIYEALLKDPAFNGYTFYWALDNLEIDIPGNCKKIKSDTLKYFVTALKCKYWVACVNIERSLHFKKRKTVYLNTWHGTPLKTIGNSASQRKDYDFSNIDYFCSAGEYEKEIYIRDFLLRPDSIINTGLPRNDELYAVNDSEISEIREKMGLPIGKKILLYAPTWRDSVDKGKTYSLKPPIDVKKWEAILKDEYVLLFRAHPYTNKLLGIEFNSFVIDCTEYPFVNDLLKISDVLISDYSATIFDYSILEKPIICFGYDYDSYGKDRGLYVDLEKEMPSGVLRTEDEVLEKIRSMDYAAEIIKTKAFKEKYLEYGGNATEECIKSLFGLKG